MKHLKLALFSLFIHSSSIGLFSQSSFDVHVGAAIPLSDISTTKIIYMGGEITEEDNAVTGINMGLKYNYQITVSGFGAFAGIDFLYNGINKDYKELMKTNNSHFGIEKPKFHAFYNIPLSFGGFYKYSAHEKFAFYANGGMAINFLKISDRGNEYYTIKTDLSNSIGFIVGTGIVFKERFSFQINYFGLGKHEYTTYDIEYPEEATDSEIIINMLTLSIGIYF
jgi:hypothetical protein